MDLDVADGGLAAHVMVVGDGCGGRGGRMGIDWAGEQIALAPCRASADQASTGNRPPGQPRMYLAWKASRSSGVISLNRTFGLCNGGHRRRGSRVPIFFWSPR